MVNIVLSVYYINAHGNIVNNQHHNINNTFGVGLISDNKVYIYLETCHIIWTNKIYSLLEVCVIIMCPYSYAG